jgi:hypothetical protein
MEKTKKELNVQIEWSNVDKMIDDGNCKINILAKELGVKQDLLRDAFVKHYGDKIEFKRGRKGGVYWVKQ